ncbi:MFS transporter [Rhodococcus sp. NPDC003318]|uniref:MFS transporter n=1 Tax=Rhodococcus sp. NPDC003318 TaxID=3364503 RepID=UPI00368070C0
MAMGFAAFGGWSLLLPVIPLTVSEGGGSDAVAGAVTTVFMAATVATQLGTPRLLQVRGYRLVLAAGCLLLGVPALVFLLSTAAPVALGVSVVRGVGFGLVTVAGSALVAELVPRELLGRATGAQGIAIAVGQMIALPAGLALYGGGHADLVYLLGAAVPLLAVGAIAALPPVRHARAESGRRSLPRSVLLVPCLSMLVVASVHGGVASLLPIAVADRAAVAGLALAVVSGATLVGRYAAGLTVDRIGVGRIMVPALATAASGAAVFAAAIAVAGSAGIALLMAGAVLFGAGFGAVQNEALVTLLRSAGPARLGAASAAWNVSYDAGTGVGALTLGVVAGLTGYIGVFTVSAIAVVLVMPVALLIPSTGRPADRVVP